MTILKNLRFGVFAFLLVFLLLGLVPVQAQTETTLHEFSNGADGAYPFGGLVADGAGNYFGVTTGYRPSYGTVFELSPAAGGGWTVTTLYTFQGGTDGFGPIGTLARDKAGNLYGTTYQGGNGTASACDNGTGQKGCGTIFEISPNGSGGWQKTTLYQFQGYVFGHSKDGAVPLGRLTLDSAGNLYGTTLYGGFGCGQLGCGTVFELIKTSTGWREQILVQFTGGYSGGPGGFPKGGVIFDAAGNLYGTTSNGGSGDSYCIPDGCGTAFKMTKQSGKWIVNPIHNFTGYDGAFPSSELVMDVAGNLYGDAGGGNAAGIIYQLSPTATGWKESIIHQFHGGDGTTPNGSLILDQAGNLYGATYWGGTETLCFGAIKGCGVVFELMPTSSGSWQEQVLYRLTGNADGSFPNAPLIFDGSGNLYGVADGGGSDGWGTVFEITPQ